MDLDDNEIYEEKESKNKKEGLFSFSKINKYYIFPFLCPIASLICNVFMMFVYEDKKFQGNQFLASIFAMLLLFFWWDILYIFNQTKI